MEQQSANTLEATFQALIAACGGEQQVAGLLAEQERNYPDGVGLDQILRLMDELRGLMPAGRTLNGVVPQVTEVRPQVLECDVVRFQNNKEKWVALVGLLDGYPYEIFTGLQDDDEGIMIPKSVSKGRIVKQANSDGTKRYDFQFENTRGYKITVEGLSERFNPEYWNYAKLISGVLRYRMPIENVIKLVASLQLHDESINTWKNGVERALKKYLPGQNDNDDQTPNGDE